MKYQTLLSGVTCAAALALLPLSAVAAPAVSALNGKVELIGGTISDEGAGFLNGAVSVPLGEHYGLQIDASAGSVDGDTAFGGAAHLFVRDPSEGLLGLYASYSQMDDDANDIGVVRLGIEGEYYWDRITLSAMAGSESGDVDSGLFTLEEISYYATDDLRLYAAHRFAQEGHVGSAGVEWQIKTPMSTGVAVFLEGRTGANDYDSVLAGVRLYLGEGKSLIKRHREDDPAIRILDDQFSIAQACPTYEMVRLSEESECEVDIK